MNNENELKSIFKYLLDFAKHPEQYNDDMIALLKVEQVIELLNYIDILNNQLQQKENIIKEVREYLNNCSILAENLVDRYCIDNDVKDDILQILEKENNNG